MGYLVPQLTILIPVAPIGSAIRGIYLPRARGLFSRTIGGQSADNRQPSSTRGRGGTPNA